MIKHTISGTTHDLILYHNVGEKFSKFLAETLKAMTQDLSFNITIQSVDRDILFISFREISRT